MVCAMLRRPLAAGLIVTLSAGLLAACSAPEQSARYASLGSPTAARSGAGVATDYDYTADPGWVTVAERRTRPPVQWPPNIVPTP